MRLSTEGNPDADGRKVPKGQLELKLPLDPVQLAPLTSPERGAIYREAGLDPLQIDAIEQAVRLVLRGRYGRGIR